MTDEKTLRDEFETWFSEYFPNFDHAPKDWGPKMLMLLGFEGAHERYAPRWLPIDEAARDGKPWLIGWFERDGTWTERRAWYDPDLVLGWDREQECEVTTGGWTDNAVVSFGYEEVKQYFPTHYMPLPDGPEAGR